ncbi:hypothetical protein AB0I66_00755 [Streptomyces sp. NPDC050439]|uniref:hypothetical protein n=1 Tax=unclassified Streptomyces TaxID=2593676 RepID=UPI003448CF8C
MPKPIPMNRRLWIAVWAVLCAGGLAATTALNTSSTRDAQPTKPVSAECGRYIANIEKQLAKAKQEGDDEDGVVALSGIRVSAEEDCGDEFRDHFAGNR